MVILTLDPNYYVCINLCVCPSTKVLGSVGTLHVDGLLTRCGMLNKPQLTEGGWCWLPAATCLVFALNKASLTKKLQLFVKKTDDRTLPLFLSTLGVHSLQSVSSIMQKKKYQHAAADPVRGNGVVGCLNQEASSTPGNPFASLRSPDGDPALKLVPLDINDVCYVPLAFYRFVKNVLDGEKKKIEFLTVLTDRAIYYNTVNTKGLSVYTLWCLHGNLKNVKFLCLTIYDGIFIFAE